MSAEDPQHSDSSHTKPSFDTPMLVINNGEISVTPSGKTGSPKLRRRSSSLDNRLHGKYIYNKNKYTKILKKYKLP